jgi:hypothetical protein
VVVAASAALALTAFAADERPVPMMKVPSEVSMACRAERLVRAICPTRLPKTDQGYDGYVAITVHRSGWVAVSISHAIEHHDVRRDAPPGFAHVNIEAGKLTDGPWQPFTYPHRGTATPVRNGLLFSRVYKRASNRHNPYALYLGHARWSGRRGTLAVAPPYTIVDSLDAGHLIFRWRQGGRDRAISLHAWEPFLEAVRR